MIALIILLAIFLVSGTIFALPAFIPALRQRARQSPQYRSLLIVSMSIITFVVLFTGISYMKAKAAKIFATVASGPTFFGDDAERAALLTQELWFRAMIPPWMQSDTTCLTGDASVCEATRELFNFNSIYTNSTTGSYILMLVTLLIPATVCGFTVRNITYSNRKQKSEIQI